LRSMDTNIVAPLARRVAELLLRRIESTNAPDFFFFTRNATQPFWDFTTILDQEVAAAVAARAVEALVHRREHATNWQAYDLRDLRRYLDQFIALAATKLSPEVAARASRMAVAELKTQKEVYAQAEWTDLLTKSLARTAPSLAASLAAEGVEFWVQK